MKNIYGLQIADNLYTYDEIAVMINYSTQYLTTLMKKLGLKPVEEHKSNKGHKFFLFDDAAKEKVFEYMRVESKAGKRENKINEANRKKNEAIEKMKREHPLVTDERFFIESYFPDVELEPID